MSDAALSALLAQVFPPAVARGICAVARADMARLFHVEHSAVEGAVPARQREFAAGRIAARQAMGRDLPVVMAEDRAPVWPAGVTGSITHAGGWALAVAGVADKLIGIDLEVDAALPAEVWETVLTASEHAALRDMPDAGRWARVIFSAKECAYKAQYPRTKQLFGFEVFEVTLEPVAGEFTVVFQRDIASFAAGDRLRGRYSIGGGFILTGIA
ncbi:4'-phosphopantetheinyl transferase family protein [Pararhodobacter oceanensis]|uniref:4'-phosphopantetheinyl transferase family protein n=1 Tax=Pararhodobacter oceanensis TaxID=2172121 RepID=UPI003A8F38D0